MIFDGKLKLFGGIRPLGKIQTDIVAGIKLAFTNIPQVLGYTRIAGMPIITGLYTVFLPLIGFAIFGSSRQLVVAADSATAAVFSSSLSLQAAPGSVHYIALVGMVALLTSAMLLLARIFRLGFLADFLSQTVLIGFLTGVGVQVGIAMLGDMLGVGVYSHRSLLQLQEIVQAAPQFHSATLMLSMLVVVSVVLGRSFAPRVPISMLAVVGTIAASQWFKFAERGIATIGPIPGGLPSFGLPSVDWGETLALLPLAASCFFIIIAQSAATSRVFALRRNERVDADADILGLAAANALAAISGTFVVNGSPTQTAMAERAGAQSQIAQLVFAGVVSLVLLTLTGPLQYLPRAVLAGIVFTIVIRMIDIERLAEIRRESPGEFYLALLTAGGVVVLGVEHGIMVAIAISLLRHVSHSYNPHTTVLAPDAAGRWEPVPATTGKQCEPGLIIYRFGADLFYANENRFVDEVRALVGQGATSVRWLIVDAGAITDIDYSAARAIRALVAEMESRGVTIVFARVNSYLRADMERHGITAAIGAGRIFTTLHEGIEAAGQRLR